MTIIQPTVVGLSSSKPMVHKDKACVQERYHDKLKLFCFVFLDMALSINNENS